MREHSSHKAGTPIVASAIVRLTSLVGCALALLSGSCGRVPTSTTDAPSPPLGDRMESSPDAAAIIARAKKIQTMPSRNQSVPWRNKVVRPKTRRQPAAPRTILAVSSAEARIVGATIHAYSAKGKSAAIDVAYPTSVHQSRVLKLSSGAALSLVLHDATDASAEYANGYIVYRNGTRAGANVIVRPSENGFEDYFFFDSKPKASRVVYDLALSPTVAGLRLSSNILELVGADGAPLVHLSPPFLVDSAGKRTSAKISVAGCAFDKSTQPTWKRRPTTPGATSCQISIAWDDDGVQYPALLDPTWETAGAMPLSGNFNNSEILAGRAPQQIVVFGFEDDTGPLNTTIFFDADSATWSVGPPTVVARGGGTSVLQQRQHE